jgi:hypothetical protein
MFEGGSYSYLEVQALLDYGQAATDKGPENALMILSHRDAAQYLVDNVERIDVSPQTLGTLHEMLSRGPATSDFAGIAARAQAIDDPFEQSVFLLGATPGRRIGRLACNIPLLKHSLAPLSFLEMDRTQYNQALEACARDDIDPLKVAYIDAYLATAPRYHVQAAPDPAAIELEVRRRVSPASGFPVIRRRRRWPIVLPISRPHSPTVTARLRHLPAGFREALNTAADPLAAGHPHEPVELPLFEGKKLINPDAGRSYRVTGRLPSASWMQGLRPFLSISSWIDRASGSLRASVTWARSP